MINKTSKIQSFTVTEGPYLKFLKGRGSRKFEKMDLFMPQVNTCFCTPLLRGESSGPPRCGMLSDALWCILSPKIEQNKYQFNLNYQFNNWTSWIYYKLFSKSGPFSGFWFNGDGGGEGVVLTTGLTSESWGWKPSSCWPLSECASDRDLRRKPTELSSWFLQDVITGRIKL